MDLDKECHCGKTPEGYEVWGTRCPIIEHQAQSGKQWRKEYLELYRDYLELRTRYDNLTRRLQTMINEPMTLEQLESLDADANLIGDVEGQEAELQADASRQVIEAITEFLVLGTPEELNSLIQANI